jgi:hypothetical protein
MGSGQAFWNTWITYCFRTIDFLQWKIGNWPKRKLKNYDGKGAKAVYNGVKISWFRIDAGD